MRDGKSDMSGTSKYENKYAQLTGKFGREQNGAYGQSHAGL